jgi:hypothetical protein
MNLSKTYLYPLFLTLSLVLFSAFSLAAPSSDKGPGKSAFDKIATDGFGDPQNNYAFSSAKFRGDVYVGTGRNFLFRIFDILIQGGILPPDYEYQYITRPEGDAWSEERAQDMSAEIWRHRKGVWQKMYVSSPADVAAVGYPGAPLPPEEAWAAQEPGFRSMITFSDKWGEEAVYAASAASFVPGHLLIKSTDGENWEKVVTAPTIVESDSRSTAVHNGKLYIGPAGAGAARLWATDDPLATGDSSNWQLMGDFTAQAPGTNVAVVSMASWRGHLYVGTQNDEAGFQLWRSNASSPEDPSPGEWTRIIDSGAGDMASTRALTMRVFKDALFVGTSMFPLAIEPPYLLPFKGFELIRVAADDSWKLIVGDYFAQKPVGGVPQLRLPVSHWPGGFGNFLNLYCWSLQDYNGVLYLGSFDTSSFLAVIFAEEAIAGALSLPEPTSNRAELVAAAEALGKVDPKELPDDYQWLLNAVDLSDPDSVDWEAVWQEFLQRFAGADLWKSNDGIHWEPVTLNGFDKPSNYGFRTMQRFNSLYVGSANPFDGLEMFRGKKGGPNK